MLNEYIFHDTKKLRCGYTTGSCAAGASKAAAEMLITGNNIDSAVLPTPKGIMLSLDIVSPEISFDYASCAIRKDSGDDPDITNGILVFARAQRIASGIEIDGGCGIGRVTKNGLDQPVGAAAINSVPRKMIEAAVAEIIEKYDYSGGIKIIISVPGGEEIAKKTYNPRLGIIGGISIIGTSGIVEPMSNSALIDTIRTEVRMRSAEGLKNLLFTIGNYSEDFLKKEMPLVLEKSVKCSNFVGEAIEAGLEFGFECVLIVGHAGKLVKLGAGIMNMHSSQADGRMDVLVTCGVLAGADCETLKKIPECVTVDEALEILEKSGFMRQTMIILLNRISFYLNAKVKNTIKIGAVVFSNKYGILGKTENAQEIISKISEEYNG
ncbi:MAG: cobalt-precorrin-5B (C(1))-methyltransferase CbiD [Oscillospiraceae bacterium]|jgi:cobalt-precorrin-5B (C1)-methyltransferase